MPPASETEGETDVDVSVIVPAYREAENLPVLVPRISAALGEAGLRWEVVIVDDDSRDGTQEACASLSGEYPVRLLVRKEERGLSSAVVHGMRQARGAVLVVMDADLSHPPEKIPDLVGALRDESVDFVIGSRYVEGGSTDEDWGLLRKLNSRAATLLAWPLARARDPMAGFFALRRKTLETASDLNPVGYKIGLELMVKGDCRNIREIPIRFSNRLHGESKLSLKEQINYVRHLRRLYEFKLGRFAQPAQFVVVGATGMVVDLSCFAILLQLTPYRAARAVAIWIAMTWNFWLNRKITFAYAQERPVMRQYVSFCLSCLVGAVVNWLVSIGLIANVEFFHTWKALAAVCGVVAGTVFNYVLCLTVVFRK